MELKIHTFLTLALIDMSQKLHAAHCSTLSQWQDPSNHEIDDKVDCRPTLIIVWNREIFMQLLGSEPLLSIS